MHQNAPKLLNRNAQLVLFDPRAYVRWSFSAKGLSYVQALASPAMLSTLILDYNELIQVYKAKNPNTKVKGLSDKQIQHGFQEAIEAMQHEELLQVLSTVSTTGENLEPLKLWVKAVTGDCKDTDVAAIAHWVWQCKRKGNDLRVVHHIMPVVYGKQGGGKTMALEKLIEPISRRKLEIHMTQLTDNRMYEGFANNLVALFDELQGIDRTDLNALKHQVTTNVNSYRRLHTHATLTVPQRCSFIGATNKRLNENFSDSTGMRRFFELVAQDKLDWVTVNSIDYSALWRGIDEKKDSGYLEGTMLQEVGKIQEHYKDEDDTDTFIEEHKLVGDTETKLLTKAEIYNAYSSWASLNGIRATSSQWLTKRLKSRNIETLKQGTTRYFKVSVDCTIGAKQLTVLKGL